MRIHRDLIVAHDANSLSSSSTARRRSTNDAITWSHSENVNVHDVPVALCVTVAVAIQLGCHTLTTPTR